MPQRRITTRGHKNTEAGQSFNQGLTSPLTSKADQEKTSLLNNGRQFVDDKDYQDEEDSLPVRGLEEEEEAFKGHIQSPDKDDIFIQDSNNPYQDNSIMTKGHVQLPDDHDPFAQDNNFDQDRQYSKDQGVGYQTQPRGILNQEKGIRQQDETDHRKGSRQRETSQRGEEEEGIRPRGGFNQDQGRSDTMMQGSGHWREQENHGMKRGNNQSQFDSLQQLEEDHDQKPKGRQREDSRNHPITGLRQHCGEEGRSNNGPYQPQKREERTRYGRQDDEEYQPRNGQRKEERGRDIDLRSGFCEPDPRSIHYESDQRPRHLERERGSDLRQGGTYHTDRNEPPRRYEGRDEYYRREGQGRDDLRRRERERQYLGEDRRGALIRMRIFYGKEGEDVEMFIDIIDATFREDEYVEEERERMKVLHLASYLEGDALNWWSKLDPARKRTWVEATNALKFKYNRATMRMSTERLERQRAQIALNNLRQGDMTCEEYLNTADDMYYRLGASYDRTLAMNFLQGISNPVIQSVVNGLVMDNYSYEQVQEAFIRATRCQRKAEMQKRLDDKCKAETKDESLTKTLLEVQANMTKMMLDNQRMMAMMLENQAVGLGKGLNASQDSLVRTSQDSTTRPAGITCYGCGQKGHYKNECTTNVQPNRQQWRSQNPGRFMVGAKAGTTEVSTNAVGTREEGMVIHGDNEGSGTLGMRVASNMVELIYEGNTVIEGRAEEEVAAVSKRNRESSSSGVASGSGRPVSKRPRAEPIQRTEQDQRTGLEGNSERPIRIPVTRRKEKEDHTQENTLPLNEGQSKTKVKRRRRNPLEITLRKPRMMEGEPEWDYVKAIRDLRVDISVGQLMMVSPITRAAFAYGAIIPSAPKKKGKRGVRQATRVQDSQLATKINVSVTGALQEPTEEVYNFHTVAQVNGRTLQNVLIDGGSVVNLIPDRVARELKLTYRQNNDLQIRTATGDIWPIHYYTLFEVTIAGVTAQVRAYIIAKSTTYTLLLGRRWMKQVKAKGDYKSNTYEIEGEDGIRRMIPEEVRTKGPQNRVLEVEINPAKEKGKLRLPKEEVEGFMESANRSLNKVINQLGEFTMENSDETEGEETEGDDEWEEESGDDDSEEGNEEEY